MTRVSYLARLLDVLEYVATREGPVSVREVAGGVDVPTSTASRLVGLLHARGYLQRLPAQGAYIAGPELVHIALHTVSHLHGTRRLEAATRSLALVTGESVSAGLLFGPEIVLVARQEPDHSLRIVARVGDIIAPHISAMGKAVLAHLPEPRRLEVLTAALGPDLARKTLEHLRQELEEVAVNGFAVDEQTYAVGQRCRASALVDHNGEAVGGLSIAGPAARFTVEAAEAAIPELCAEAERMSMRLQKEEQ